MIDKRQYSNTFFLLLLYSLRLYFQTVFNLHTPIIDPVLRSRPNDAIRGIIVSYFVNFVVKLLHRPHHHNV